MTDVPGEFANSRSGKAAKARFAALAARLKGPGGLYNLGNVIGFLGGVTGAIVSIPKEDFGISAALAAAGVFISGSPAALTLTAATVIFFWSGEEYHRAWSAGFPPDEARVRTGDLSSALGAVLLAFAFLALGNLVLALTAGVLHACGKLGSAWGTARMMENPGSTFRWATLCRESVLLSRAPALAISVTGLLARPSQGGDASSHIVSGSLLACCLVWAVADIQLLPATSVFSPKRYRSRA